MKQHLTAQVYIRLDGIEQFDWITPTGKVRVDQIEFHMAESEANPGLFALPPEVQVSGRAIKVDGTAGLVRRQVRMRTRSLPPKVMAQLPRRAQFFGGVS